MKQGKRETKGHTEKIHKNALFRGENRVFQAEAKETKKQQKKQKQKKTKTNKIRRV